MTKRKGAGKMPYKMVVNGQKFDVVNIDTEDVKASHDTKEDAEKQVELLNRIEKDMEPKGE